MIYIKTLLFILFLFGMFVPYGYMGWYWAVPISILSFLNIVGIIEQHRKG